MGKPLMTSLVRCLVSFKRKPAKHSIHEVLVFLLVQLKNIVGGNDDPEPVLFFRMTLGSVHEILHVFQEFLCSSQRNGSITINDDAVESRNRLLITAMTIHKTMIAEVVSILLSENMKLIKGNFLCHVIEGKVSAIGYQYLIDIGFLKRFTFEEVNPISGGFLNNEMLLVSPCYCKGHHFIPN